MNSKTLVQPNRIAPFTCNKCGVQQHAAEAVDRNQGRRPKANDLSLCSNCGALSFFVDEIGHLRPATWADINWLKAHNRELFDQMCETQRAIVNSRTHHHTLH